MLQIRNRRGAALAVLWILSAGAVQAAGAPRVAAALPTAAPATLGFSAERLSRIDRYLEDEIAAKHKAGAVVVLARRGKIAYFKAFGAADVASGRPMRTDDYFRWASMTKPVTSVALLTLYEQGKFQLTDPLSKYLPEFKDVRVYTGLAADGTLELTALTRPITIADVFRHTAGFTYGYFGATPVDKAYAAAGLEYAKLDSLAELVGKLAQQPLLHQPGARYNYSFAHDVQAYLVEHFAGMRFDDYCQRTIFAPLGMRETQFGVRPDRADRYPTVYRSDANGALVAVSGGANGDSYARFGQHPFGGYGLSGPPRDFVRFAQMLLNGGELDGVRILGRKTVELMTADHLPPAAPDLQDGIRHGLGVFVVTDLARSGNLGSVGQYGRGGVATTYFLNDPKEQLLLLLFSQYVPLDQPFVDTWQTLVYQALER